MTWKTIPIDFGPHLLVRVVFDGREQPGVWQLDRAAYTDLRRRLGEPVDDLHDLHPQPGDPAVPLPAGVDGFDPTRPTTSTTG